MLLFVFKLSRTTLSYFICTLLPQVSWSAAPGSNSIQAEDLRRERTFSTSPRLWNSLPLNIWLLHCPFLKALFKHISTRPLTHTLDFDPTLFLLLEVLWIPIYCICSILHSINYGCFEGCLWASANGSQTFCLTGDDLYSWENTPQTAEPAAAASPKAMIFSPLFSLNRTP